MNEAMGRDVVMCCSTEDGHAMGMCCCRDLTALRATIQQQAERIERLTAERDAAYIRERAKYEATMIALQRQLAERDATIAELERRMGLLCNQNGSLLIEQHDQKQREQRLRAALERAEHTMIALLPNHPRWQADGTEHDPCGLHAALACVQDALESSPSPQGGDAPNRER